MQKPASGEGSEDKVPEHTASGDDIFTPSEEVIDFSEAKTEKKDVVHNVVDLEDVKVVDRDKEGVLEFTTEGSKKKSKPQKKRISTIEDYVKKRGDKYATMDYISIDDDEFGPSSDQQTSRSVDDEDLGVKPKGKDEPEPELEYISIDDEEEDEMKTEDKTVGKAVKFEEKGEIRETFNCPHCDEIIEIPSSRRPITLKCPGCKTKGVLRY
jgi:hypothetical protein